MSSRPPALEKLTVSALQEILRQQGCRDVKGLKKDLIARLKALGENGVTGGAVGDDKNVTAGTDDRAKPVKGANGAGLSWAAILLIISSCAVFAVVGAYFGMHIQSIDSSRIIYEQAREKSRLVDGIREARKYYDELEGLYVGLKDKVISSCEGIEESAEDKQKATDGNNWDDKEDFIFCWLDKFFDTSNFTDPSECDKLRKRNGPQCPFVDAEDTLNHLRMHSLFIELELSSPGGKERRKLKRQLSTQFHTDKMHSMGCPAAYGHEAMVFLNSNY